MTFSVFLDILYPPNFGCFEKNGVFQQPRDVTPTIGQARARRTFLQFSVRYQDFPGSTGVTIPVRRS